MKALLVNPFLYDFAAFDFWAKPRGLLEVGVLLQQLGYEVELIDCLYPQDEGMAAFVNSPVAADVRRLKYLWERVVIWSLLTSAATHVAPAVPCLTASGGETPPELAGADARVTPSSLHRGYVTSRF